MAILIPDLTVEVYNADYRVLSRIPWQEAVRLILRGAVYVIDVHSPAVHVRSPSLVIELPVSVASARVRAHPTQAGQPGHPRGRASPRPAHLRILRRARRHRGPRPAAVPWGGDTWFNLVAACQSCNGRKGDRTPQEAG